MSSAEVKAPPIAQAAHRWDAASHTLSYEYGWSTLLSLFIPEDVKAFYREYSNGNIQSSPFVQQLYLALDQPAKVKVRFHLSEDALNMRPHRANKGQAILGQVGKPLLRGVGGLYDVLRDLLIDWHGPDWTWTKPSMELTGDGTWQAEAELEAGLQPWIINLRMQYYRTHLHYEHHKPWEWRPNLKPITGWSSWEAFGQGVTADDIDRTAAFLEKHFKDYGLRYMQIDDGYQTEHIPPTSDGAVPDAWLQTNERFPGQHEELVASIRNRGFQAGIWTSAMVTNVDFAEANRDLFELDEKGEPLYGPWIYYVLKGAADVLAEQAAPHYEGLKEKGYDYFKTDQIRHYLFDGLHKAVNEGLLTSEEAADRLRQYLLCAREHIGDDAYFLACWGVLTEAVGIVDACRIAGDSNPSWSAVCKQMVESARWFHTQRILYLNDPDYVCVRTEEAWGKSLLSLVTLTGGLLMISDNPDLYDKERIHSIQRCMPALPTAAGETGHLDMTYPLDLTLPQAHGDSAIEQALPYAMLGLTADSQEPYPPSSLWAIHFDQTFRRWCVTGRFAVIPLASTVLKLEALALDPDETYHAFDFWKQRYMGTVARSMEMEALELGHCQIIALIKAEKHPQLIASSRHVSMDAVSVLGEAWNGGTLRLDLSGVIETTESYWIAVPEGYRYAGHAGNGLSVEAASEEGLLRLEIQFEEPQSYVEARFEC
ncbi:hypothetical protein RB620_14015 [Paenibacillus sp. LHD-117]|uniref:hypothetical protein n=1 Tax=Paenibacillus sp. LHD-117 TaxID=3071412 RepID=UPI0027E0520C|nr:hypothetical protein [Paenibacillus sp. LHD-117]MDQ6420541.1 hypothetical protein [Paenibacillus sp. LHD-117]